MELNIKHLTLSSSSTDELIRIPQSVLKVNKDNNIVQESKQRHVSKIIDSLETKEGKGFMIHRPFLSHSISDFDPFLLLDETGPMDLKPKEANGAPDHPHRGFETVTYAIPGKIEHKDSQNHSGKLSPGDVRWMTTGSRVIHSEMPTKEFVDKSGRLHGFQLWVNLSKNDKMTKYSYQDIPSLNIPIIKITDEKGVVRVIAGQAFDSNSIIKTRIPILYLHMILDPDSKEVLRQFQKSIMFLHTLSQVKVFGKDEKIC